MSQVAIKLEGGPGILNGWSNIYDAALLGGWPPPDEIVAFEVAGVVALALPAQVPEDAEVEVTRYRQVRRSQLPDEADAHPNIVRGAVYEVVTP